MPSVGNLKRALRHERLRVNGNQFTMKLAERGMNTMANKTEEKKKMGTGNKAGKHSGGGGKSQGSGGSSDQQRGGDRGQTSSAQGGGRANSNDYEDDRSNRSK